MAQITGKPKVHSRPSLPQTTKRTMEKQKPADRLRRQVGLQHPEVTHLPHTSRTKDRSSGESRRSSASSRIQQRRQRRLFNGGNTASQKTLTQIKFVDCPPAGEDADDDDLEYIGERSTGNSRRNNVGDKRQKRGNGGRGNPMMDPTDDTLTQMGWVGATAATSPSAIGSRRNRHAAARRVKRNERRSSPIPQKEPQNRPRSKKRRVSEMETIKEEPEMGNMLEAGCPSKRVKSIHDTDNTFGPVDLDTCETASDAKHNERALRQDTKTETRPDDPIYDCEDPVASTPGIPVTPQKPRGRVIPSSQSPDSPEVLYLGQNTLTEYPSRCPLRPISHNAGNRVYNVPPAEDKPTELSPHLKPFDCHDSGSARDMSPSAHKHVERSSNENQNEAQAQSAMEPTRQTLERPRPSDTTSPIQDHLTASRSGDVKKCDLGSQRSRLEVLSESDNGPDVETDEFHDTFSQLSDAEIQHSKGPDQPSNHYASHGDTNITSKFSHMSDPPEDAPQSTACSDMSMLYCRRPLSSHFEPANNGIPDLSSGGLAELFATQGLEGYQHSRATTKNHTDSAETKSARESTPAQHNDAPSCDVANDSSIPPPSPVVLVESSQRREPRQHGEHEDNSSGGDLLTPSQLLTESLMESIPGPPGWISSQACDMQEETAPWPCDRS